MPTIRLLSASEEKSWRALLGTEEPAHCFKSKEKGKLYTRLTPSVRGS